MKISIGLSFLLIVVSSFFASAQDNSKLGYSGAGIYGAGMTLAKDYEAVGVNPANLGSFNTDGTHIICLGIGEIGASLHSDALQKTQLLHALTTTTKLTEQEKTDAAVSFGENGTTIHSTIMPIGIAVQIPKVGGFAFTWQESIVSSITMNDFMANLVFKGYNDPYFNQLIVKNGDTTGVAKAAKNYSTLFDGSKINFQWVRAYNLNYGREFVINSDISLNVGVGLKYLQGFGIVNADFSNGSVTGYDAASPVFGIKYGNIDNPSLLTSTGLKPVGHGYGADFGVMVKIQKRLRIGVSVTNLGSITWNGNVLHLKDTPLDSLKNFSGVQSLNIIKVIQEMGGTDGFLNWNGEVEQKVALPALFRIGASYELNKYFEFAFDVTAPMNSQPGNLDNAMFAGGINFTPAKCIRLSTGFVTGGLITGINIPLGVALSVGPKQTWQIGISTGDIISYLKQNRPTLSATVAVLRFCF